jgi:hypothetical protein
MNLDSTSFSPTKHGYEGDDPFGDGVEAERLHKTAFEQLRTTTRADQEGFVERMRRWEAEQAARTADAGVEMRADEPDQEEELRVSEVEDEEEDDIELTLELGSQTDRRSPPPVTNAELDELTRRLCAGACELEDFSIVREVQARTRGSKVGRGVELAVQA